MLKYNFRFKTFTILALFILIQVLSACIIPGLSSDNDEPSDLKNTETSLAQTLESMNAATDTPVPTDTLAPSATLPGDPPPAAATTVAAPPAAATTVAPPPPTAGPPIINADIDTNCRQGPSALYPVLGYLTVGQSSIVTGRHASSSNPWWFIENPKKPGNYCWVWGETTRVEGDTSMLPIITPPPPPTLTPTSGVPSITASFSNVHNCGGTPTAIFQLTNTGSSTIESVMMTIVDLNTNTTVYSQSSNSPFFNSANGCPPGGPSLPPGTSAFVGGAIGPIPVGNTLQMTASLCTGDNQTGACLTYQFNFAMP